MEQKTFPIFKKLSNFNITDFSPFSFFCLYILVVLLTNSWKMYPQFCCSQKAKSEQTFHKRGAYSQQPLWKVIPSTKWLGNRCWISTDGHLSWCLLSEDKRLLTIHSSAPRISDAFLNEKQRNGKKNGRLLGKALLLRIPSLPSVVLSVCSQPGSIV